MHPEKGTRSKNYCQGLYYSMFVIAKMKTTEMNERITLSRKDELSLIKQRIQEYRYLHHTTMGLQSTYSLPTPNTFFRYSCKIVHQWFV